MQLNILPEGLYPVIVPQAWVRLSSTTYWNLELEFCIDSKGIPLHDIEQIKSSRESKGRVVVKRIIPIEKSPLNQIEVGNRLVAINNEDLGDLNAETIQKMLQQATESTSTTLLLYRENYTEVSILLHQSHPMIDPFEIGRFNSNGVTWYYTREHILFATSDHSQEALTQAMTTQIWQMYHRRRNELLKTLNIWDQVDYNREVLGQIFASQIFSMLTDHIWQMLCGIIFDENLQSEMVVPYIPHLNLNQDARHKLYRIVLAVPTSFAWDLDLVVQAPYSLKVESLFSAKAPKGIVLVRSSPVDYGIVPGDILVAINDVFLTTSIPSLVKRLKRVASISSQQHPSSLMLLRHNYLQTIQQLNMSTLVRDCSENTVAKLLSDIQLPEHLFPPKAKKLCWLHEQSKSYEVHTYGSLYWYRHKHTNRVHCEHPLRVLLYPFVQAAHTRFVWTCNNVQRCYRAKIRLEKCYGLLEVLTCEGVLDWALEICIRHVLSPVVLEYAGVVVDNIVESVADTFHLDAENLFLANLHRFRYLHRSTEVDSLKPLIYPKISRRNKVIRQSSLKAIGSTIFKGDNEVNESPSKSEQAEGLILLQQSTCLQFQKSCSDETVTKSDAIEQDNEALNTEAITETELPLAVQVHSTTAQVYTTPSPTNLTRFSPLKSALLKASTETPLLHPTVLEPYYTRSTSLDIQQRWIIPPLALGKIPIRRKKGRKPNALEVEAATKIQSWIRGCCCRAKYRAKREKLNRRRAIRNEMRSLSPFLNERPERFPPIPNRRPKAIDADTDLHRTELTARQEA